MSPKLTGPLAVALLLACTANVDESTAADSSTAAGSSTGPDEPTTAGSSSGATSEPGCDDADKDGFGAGCTLGDDCDDGVSTCAQDCSDLDGNAVPECAEAPGMGVMLFTGANGGGPPTDLHVDSLAALYTKAGFATETTNAFPADFVTTTGTMLILNPLDLLGEKVLLGARALLLRGGRVVLVMEHCKNGCYGNADGNNAFLEALGSSMRLSGEGGAPLSKTPLALAAAPPTQGLTAVTAFYSGSVMVGDGLALGTMDGGAGDVVLGYEALYNGDIVVAADSSIFGYVLAEADNSAFVVALAGTLLGGS